MITTNIDPISRDVELILRDDLSPNARSAAIAEVARAELKAAEDKNRAALGRIPSHQTFVDGRAGAALESINPDRGTIVFEFDLLIDVFGWIADALVKHSPKLTGRYAASHILLADGVEVRSGEQAPDAAEYAFVNAQPYARKIERGLSNQAPDGVYQVVAMLAARRFGNVAKVRFSYRSLIGTSALDSWARGTRIGHRGHASAQSRNDWLRRQPAVVVTV
ncbi:hypothetical protein [Rhodoplanes roseus]|uniref:Uncharacterized protein n=1 Tax=Rhodoplanes roseus TaxID=29409 RepID=A0A327LAF4_9BRAD|nr:hypothetical protein [Rhodoplanes roseus]RAI44708.1 hypothetical protein CH341_07780 [Rhodoplanes roseus]